MSSLKFIIKSLFKLTSKHQNAEEVQKHLDSA
jgi:hypothetical protein